VDHAVTGHDAVARRTVVLHAEVGATVLDEHVPLFEGVGVEQQLDALARGQLALAVLRFDALLAAAEPGLRALGLELLDDVVHVGSTSRTGSTNCGRRPRARCATRSRHEGSAAALRARPRAGGSRPAGAPG